jgi:hypothetical protein
LHYNELGSVFKDAPEATSVFAENDDFDARTIEQSYLAQQGLRGSVETNLIEQLDDLIARLVVETHADPSRGFFRELMTTRLAFVPASSCSEYGPACDRRDRIPCPIDPDETPLQDSGLTCNAGRCMDQRCPDADRGGRENQRVYNLQEHLAHDLSGREHEVRWVTLPENERAGVLTHPAWLAAHGGNFEDDGSAIYRGKWIREQLLCQTPLSLEGLSIQAQLIPREDERNTDARTRLEASMEQSEADVEESGVTCANCHNLMNPLGYPFEIYNHAGFLRDAAHPRMPDPSSTLVGMPDPGLNGNYANAIELAEALAESPYARRCFFRNTFRFFMGRDETIADACTLTRMETAYDDSGGSFIAVLQALATSDAFLYRHDPMEGR